MPATCVATGCRSGQEGSACTGGGCVHNAHRMHARVHVHICACACACACACICVHLHVHLHVCACSASSASPSGTSTIAGGAPRRRIPKNGSLAAPAAGPPPSRVLSAGARTSMASVGLSVEVVTARSVASDRRCVEVGSGLGPGRVWGTVRDRRCGVRVGQAVSKRAPAVRRRSARAARTGRRPSCPSRSARAAPRRPAPARRRTG